MHVEITATDLSKSLSDVLNRVRYRGETFVIERNGEFIATLAPKGPVPGVSLGRLAAALGNLVPPGEGFADDLEALQSFRSEAGSPAWPN